MVHYLLSLVKKWRQRKKKKEILSFKRFKIIWNKGSFALGDDDDDKVDFSDFHNDLVVEWVQHPMQNDVVILHFVVVVKCE